MPLIDDPWLPYNGDGTVDPVRASVPIGVFRLSDATLQPLPNVYCLSVERREGTDPGRAAFRYNLGSGLPGAPTTIEEALSTESAGAYLVIPGDRLVVRATRPDGGVDCLFDGVVLSFGFGLAAGSEDVRFSAVGIAVRCWDDPISAAYMRNADNPESPGSNVQTQLVAHFNPEGRPNATVEGADVDEGQDTAHPIFIDHRIVRDPPVSRLWSVAMGVRYLIYRNNADEEFVLNPKASDLDALLVSREPSGDGYDPDDPATYEPKPLIVPDLPVTGKDWPSTVYQMVRDVGFGMVFRLNTTEGGLPETVLGIFRQQAGPVKHLYLAPRGSDFDARTTNLGGASLDRDLGEVANAFVVRGAPIRHEASFILAPGFPSAAADGSAGSLPNFDKSSPTYDAANRNKYRLYVFDETGEGHYGHGSDAKDVTATSLDELLGPDAYAVRRRKPIGTLFSKDAIGRPRKARLSISTDYAGEKPGISDGSGTWQPVADSAWSPLDDRLGIEITAANPNSWKIGKSTASGAPYPAGTVKGVESQSGMAGAVPFTLRLTCVIEADECCEHAADRRPESPLPYRVVRLVDAKDRIKKHVISSSSEFHEGFEDDTVRDDTELAKSEAIAIQFATQSGVLDGPVTIPRFTGYYGIGDRIASIEGRGLGLRTDGDATGANLVYPVVVGVRWDFEGGQRTTLSLSDAGTDRRRYRRSVRRRSDVL